MNWKRSAIAALCAVPVIWLFAKGLTKDPRDIPSPLPNHQAPAFALEVFAPGQPPLDRAIGDSIRLAAMRGDVVVLNFWASWCLECRTEHATLSDVARSYAGKPVHFVGVLYLDDPKSGTEWISKMGGQAYPGTLDPQSKTSIDYGVYGVPETYFLDRNGQVAYKNTGPVTAATLAQKIDSLLAVPAAAAK
jgi:cytochrome c biogenesis protein CcmG/thiol:disulfide interchange protein DsbE